MQTPLLQTNYFNVDWGVSNQFRIWTVESWHAGANLFEGRHGFSVKKAVTS